MNKILCLIITICALAACERKTTYIITGTDDCSIINGVTHCKRPETQSALEKSNIKQPYNGILAILYHPDGFIVRTFDFESAHPEYKLVDQNNKPVNGVLKSYYENTTNIKYDVRVEEGQETKVRQYYSDGNLEIEMDEQNHVTKMFYTDGKLKQTVQIIDGQRVYTYYDTDGNVISSEKN